MTSALVVVGAFALGAAIMAALTLLVRQRRLTAETARLAADLSAARRSADEERAALTAAQTQIRESFAALSKDALKENRQDFLHQADDLLKPVRETLDRVRTELAGADKEREGSFRDVAARLGSLATTQEQLRQATEGLTRSLRSPNVRGKWGELQLRRIVELAGMLEHVDFEEQAGGTADDARVKPDMVVRLPGASHIVIDAKVPIDAYMRASDATDEAVRARHLADHALQVKNHVRALGSKKYWDAFDPAPDFVVMFLPLEPLLSAAFERDGDLLEFAVKEHVVLATPMSLLALLRAVGFGWQQHAIARNTEAIQDAGRELCDRLAKLVEHFDRVGSSVHGAMKAYNDAVASFNARVMPSVKRFQDLKVPAASSIAAPVEREIELREITRPTLPGLDPADDVHEVEREPAPTTR